MRREGGGGWSSLCRTKDNVLEEVDQFEQVGPIVAVVELLEDCKHAGYQVRAIYLKLGILILSHDTAQTSVVAQVLEHRKGENSEETGHTLQLERHCIDLVHRIEEAYCLAADSQVL